MNTWIDNSLYLMEKIADYLTQPPWFYLVCIGFAIVAVKLFKELMS